MILAPVHLATALLAGLLIWVSVVDARTMRIPNPLNLAIVCAGALANWTLGAPLAPSIIGVVAGYLGIVAANAIYRALRGRDGVGLGDAKLLAGAGAWLGWAPLPFVVLIAAALGLSYVALVRVRGGDIGRTHMLPFGPFLSAATFIAWIVTTYR